MPTQRPPRGSSFTHKQASDVVARTNGLAGVVGDGAIVGSVSGNGSINLHIDIDVLRQRLGQYAPDMLCIVNSAAAVSGGTYQWLYTCKQVNKTIAALGESNWTGYGADISAYNLAENINDQTTGSGPYGNGVNKDDLEAEGTFDLAPIPAKSIVVVRPVMVNAATPVLEYWITGMGVPNGVTGEC